MQDRREEIIDFLNENYQPVYMLHPTLGKVDIWPLVRIKLYFSLIRNIEDSIKGVEEQQKMKKASKIKWLNRVKAFLECLSIEKHDKLLLGAGSYRVLHENRMFNKFFDPWLSNEGIILEYSGSNQGNYYSPTIHVNDALVIWSRLFHYHTYTLSEECQDFLDELVRKVEKKFGYPLDSILDQLKSSLLSISKWESLMGFLIKKTKATQVIALCYYTNAAFGAFLAASVIGIKKIDMQHGPQTDSHGAYGKWKYILREHNPLMPNEFWTWTDASAQVIKDYSKGSVIHKAIVRGNNWISFWNNRSFDINLPNGFFLFSLQPIDKPIPERFWLFIEKTAQEGRYWWIRLHPRQSKKILLGLEERVRQLGMETQFFFDDSRNIPLPAIFVKTAIHFTCFSGTAIEAGEFNVHTYFLDQRAKSLLMQNLDLYHWFDFESYDLVHN
ncbi:hypothetical protein [Roseivirga pacifica]|uniref:hypothetical protein n=1 Tax=Roseivirga pacifica TaxID=1267423 RepID=UPI00227D11F1|nr:hypothetical protein [Roseivirga pacifica]